LFFKNIYSKPRWVGGGCESRFVRFYSYSLIYKDAEGFVNGSASWRWINSVGIKG